MFVRIQNTFLVATLLLFYASVSAASGPILMINTTDCSETVRVRLLSSTTKPGSERVVLDKQLAKAEAKFFTLPAGAGVLKYVVSTVDWICYGDLSLSGNEQKIYMKIDDISRSQFPIDLIAVETDVSWPMMRGMMLDAQLAARIHPARESVGSGSQDGVDDPAVANLAGVEGWVVAGDGSAVSSIKGDEDSTCEDAGAWADDEWDEEAGTK